MLKENSGIRKLILIATIIGEKNCIVPFDLLLRNYLEYYYLKSEQPQKLKHIDFFSSFFSYNLMYVDFHSMEHLFYQEFLEKINVFKESQKT
jgi:hypothetical protein